MGLLSLLLFTLLGLAAQADTRIGVVPTSQPGLELAYVGAEFNSAWYADHSLPPYAPGRLFIATDKTSDAEVRAYLKAQLPEKLAAPLAQIKPLETDTVLTRQEFKGKTLYEISLAFPTSMRLNLGLPAGADAKGYAPNCFGAAEAFHTGEDVEYRSAEKFHAFTRHLMSVTSSEAPSFGEVLYLSEVEHAAVYLFDGIIFQKPSVGVYHHYEIVPYVDMFKTFNSTLVMARRFKGGTMHNTPWDGFIFGISSLPDLAPPPPLNANSYKLARYRPKTCGELLVMP